MASHDRLSVEAQAPWQALGVSRATFYRRKAIAIAAAAVATVTGTVAGIATATATPSRLSAGTGKPAFTVTDMMLARAKAKRRKSTQFVNPYLPNPLAFPPSARPKHGDTLAQDSSLCEVGNWAGAGISGMWAGMWGGENIAFPGYPFLSALAQVAEYRRIGEVFSSEMTRRWIKLQVAGDEDKSDKLAELNDELTRLGVQDQFRRVVLHDVWFGRSHLYVDFDTSDRRDELRIPIGDGRDEWSRAKIKPGSLKYIRAIEPLWVYPTAYNSVNALARDWYEPESWFVQGYEVDRTRLLKFVGREVPDAWKPAYSFGGLPLTMQIKARVDHWLRTNSSVSDLTHSFSVSGLKTDLGAAQMDGSDQLFKRVDLFNQMRDNSGMFLLNKETEEFFNVATPLSGLSELQAQSLEFICAASGLPLLKFTGISPSGLNATSEFEMKSWYETVNAYQEQLFRPHLTTVINFAQLNIWGHTDPTIGFVFEPLHSLDETQLATIRKTEADTDQILVDIGALSPAEIRQRIAGDADTPYQGLDPEDLPDLRAEEEAGLEPQGGHAEPIAEEDSEAEDDASEDLQDMVSRIDRAVKDPLPGGGKRAIDIALDRESIRELDQHGRLHCSLVNISCANISQYLGKEIPGWEQLGLSPEKVYRLYRDPMELQKAAQSLNRQPVLDAHIPVYADNYEQEVQAHTIGSTGESARWEAPWLQNSIVIWSQEAIAAIETGAACELSAGYHYRPVMVAGEWEGQSFDGSMVDISFNHVATVPMGRNPGCSVGQVGDE